jgi:hypothetical protein
MEGLFSQSVWSRLCSYWFGNGRIFLIMCLVLLCSRASEIHTVAHIQSLVLLLFYSLALAIVHDIVSAFP